MKVGEVYSQTDGLWVITQIIPMPPYSQKPLGLPIEEYVKNLDLSEEKAQQKLLELSADTKGRPVTPIRRV